MYIYGGSTLNLVGCKFSGNTAFANRNSADDIHYTEDSTVNFEGCPEGSSGAAGTAIFAAIFDAQGTLVKTIDGEKSYSCGVCER